MGSGEYAYRLKRFIDQNLIDSSDLFLTTHPPNLQYLFGFTGSLGCALIKRDESLLLIDSRYLEQAQTETFGCSVQLTKDPTADDLKVCLQKSSDSRSISVEARQLQFETALRLQDWGFQLKPTYDLIKKQRAVKSAAEIDLLKSAAKRADNAFDRFLKAIPWGFSEIQAAGELEYECRKSGSQGPSFETIVATGRRTSLPHAKAGLAILDSKKNLLIDFGIRYQSYCSDSTRMIIPDSCKRVREIADIVGSAQQAAFSAIQPDVPAAEIDQAARALIQDSGFGEYYKHSTGHGLGLEVHEYPYISSRSEDVLKTGMVFTVEPGIYLPGKFGVRLENTVLVTETGYELII